MKGDPTREEILTYIEEFLVATKQADLGKRIARLHDATSMLWIDGKQFYIRVATGTNT